MTASSSGPDKILVCGNVDCKFESLLARLEQIQAKFSGKDKFEQLFVCGEFFGANLDENKKIVTGEYIVPVPIYVLGPIKAESSRYYTALAGNEIAPNVVYLGRKGLYTMASGLKVAYLSGQEGDYADECHFSSDTVDELINQITNQTGGQLFQGVDVLLTSQWPEGVDKFTNHTPDVANEDQLKVSPLISKLAAALKPRYHFAAMANCHYERPAYRNYKVLQESSSSFSCTRFVGLAQCGNPSRCKWIYAFNIVPHRVDPPQSNCTEFPYADVLERLAQEKTKRALEKEANRGVGKDQYFFGGEMADSGGVPYRFGPQGGRKGRKRYYDNSTTDDKGQPPNKSCWFCLASPQVEKHMVVSIGEHVYLALAKGQLNAGHVLITPIDHVQSLVACQSRDDQAASKNEIELYKQSLDKYYAQKHQNATAVFFERNFKSQHCQLQCVAVPAEKVEQHLRKVVQDKMDEMQLEYAILPDNVQLSDVVQPGVSYFYFECPRVSLRLYAQKLPKHFPLNLGREILTHKLLLNLPESKIDWRNSAGDTVDSETKVAQQFRDEFRPFEFTNG